MPSGKKSPCCMYKHGAAGGHNIFEGKLMLYNHLLVFVNYSVYPASAIAYFHYVIGLSLFMHLL